MKLLLENWNKYLILENEDILKHNAAQLRKWVKFGGGRWELRDVAKLASDDIIKEISPLLNNKIVRKLGTGTMGVVFLLDNGHALKIFRGGWLPGPAGESELKFYRDMKDKLFSGKARIHDLPVYDYGEASNGLQWAEMARFMLLPKYSEYVGHKITRTFIDLLIGLVIKYPKRFGDPRSRKDIADHILELKKVAEQDGITLGELKGLTKMVASIGKEYSREYLGDLHEENIGILETSVASKEPVFILFDP